jgi:hypothetical protein
MSDLLIYGNRKQEDIIWDISTPEKRAAGFLALFRFLNEEWDVYQSDDLNAAQEKLFNKAVKGDAVAAECLLTMRKNCEYEEWDFGELINPLTGRK